VTPEHALTEHASWILIHQRSRPVLAQSPVELRAIRMSLGQYQDIYRTDAEGRGNPRF
jgi:hypothetical protein